MDEINIPPTLKVLLLVGEHHEGLDVLLEVADVVEVEPVFAAEPKP